MNVTTISVQQAFKELQSASSARLIDVREATEYAVQHAEPAELYPLTAWPENFMATSPNPSDAVYLICRSGGRSEVAAQLLQAKGYTNVINVSGGTNAWKAAKLPMV